MTRDTKKARRHIEERVFQPFFLTKVATASNRSIWRTGFIRRMAEEVSASRRTVLRDIGALRDEGYVIHSDVGRGGGLQLDPQSMQTRAKLSVPEVFALLISVAAMRAAGNLPYSEIAGGVGQDRKGLAVGQGERPTRVFGVPAHRSAIAFAGFVGHGENGPRLAWGLRDGVSGPALHPVRL